MDYYSKYLKYKQKYLELKGGADCVPIQNVLNSLNTVLNSEKKCSKKINEMKTIDYNNVCGFENSLAKENPTKSKSKKSSKKLTSVTSNKPIELPPEKSPLDVNIELYIPQKGGEADSIWPLISKLWTEKKSLGIRSIDKSKNLNYIIEPKNIGNIDEPILGRGTFTAVYKIKNILNDFNTEYILRIYERDLKLSPYHFMYNKKIMNERIFYNNYFYRVYNFGELNMTHKKFSFLNNEDGEKTDKYIFSNKDKNYKFDYIITKTYNTPIYDKNYNIINITNMQKFLFLYSNISMLNKLYLNQAFHADYKIDNVGWEDNEKMNVIWIDYDDGTIQKARNDNDNFNLITNNVKNYYFTSTYIPEYLKNINYDEGKDFDEDTNNTIKQMPLAAYNMYSVGGLANIIYYLEIKFTKNKIILPPNLYFKQIKSINTNKLSTSLYLDNTNLDLIPTYEDMLKILDYIKQYVK
jgi:hypothetical protein